MSTAGDPFEPEKPSESSPHDLDITKIRSIVPETRTTLVSMEAVQIYVQNERRRARRTLLQISGAFLAMVLLIFSAFLSIGILVLRKTRAAQEQIGDVSAHVTAQVSEFGRDIESIGGEVGTLRETTSAVSNTLTSFTEVHREEKRELEGDLEHFSDWVATQDRVLVQRLRKSEHEQRELRAALSNINERYTAVLAALQSSVAARGPRAAGGHPGEVEAPLEAVPASNQQPDTAIGGMEVRAASELVLRLPNGDTYRGGVSNGLFEGVGMYTHREGDKVEYRGGFAAGRKSGQGVLVFRSGARYEGGFVDDAMSGTGTFHYANGDSYEGEFVAGVKQGRGRYVYRNGDRFEGQFREGAMDGQGTFTFANGDIYSGMFRGGVREGEAVYMYAGGGRYEGQFKAGRRDGHGRFEYPDGGVFEGTFVAGRKHGPGVYRFGDGVEISGTWQDDNYRGP